jgi:hypothetical protein
MSDSDTRGWKKCEYGAFYKEIGPYRFRLHRNSGKGWWVGIEYIDAPKADTLTEAKELAHLIARGMGADE